MLNVNTTTFGVGGDAAGTDDEQPVLGDMLHIAHDHLGWILGVTAACVAAAAAYAFIATPIYESDALVRIQQASPSPGSPPSVSESLLGHSSLTDSEIQMMKSRSVLAPVVAQYHLDIHADPHRLPILGALASAFATPGEPARPWFGAKSLAWGGERIDVPAMVVPPSLEDKKLRLTALNGGRYRLSTRSGEPLLEGAVGREASGNGVTMTVRTLVARPGTEFNVVRNNNLSATSELAHALQIAELGKETGVAQISYESADPVLATNVTNSVARSAMTQNVARHRNEANAMLAFLNTEMPRLRNRVQQADRALSDFRSASGTIQSTQEAQLYLQGSIEFEKQIANLKIQRTQMLQRFEPGSPEIRSLDTQMAELAGAKHGFDARFERLPASERESADLQRDAKVAQDIYLALVSQMQALSVQRGGTVGDISLIDAAWRPSSPVKPKRALIIAASVLLGLTISALTLFARRRLFRGIDDPKLVERRLSLPMFGSIFYSEYEALTSRRTPALAHATGASGTGDALALPMKRAQPISARIGLRPPLPRLPAPKQPGHALAINQTNDLSIEALRNLRAELQFALTDVTNKVVMITGPSPGTGKSFIAANLAILLAEAGLNVLLVDADLRRGRLGAVFNQAQEGGLSEFLRAELAPTEIMRSTGTEGLSLITGGARPSDPSALLAGPRLERLLHACGKQFDAVIVDAPPVLAISDATLISRCVAFAMLVLSPGAHSEAQVSETLRKLERAGGRVLGGVFNAVPERRSERQQYDDTSGTYRSEVPA